MPAPTQHRIDPPSSVLPSRVAPGAAVTSSVATGGHQGAIDQPAGTRTPQSTSEGGANSEPLQPGGSPTSSSPQSASEPGSQQTEHLADNHKWLRLHAAELLERIQAWASELDAREAQLNARLSIQDHRERSFRLQQQDVAERLAQQQRSIERLRKENLAQARRLAFRGD